jgi:catechol 2,3-dioxygenase-like lactoylglutathione lyase family enzyme
VITSGATAIGSGRLLLDPDGIVRTMAQLEALGIVAADLAASLRFYSTLGVDVPNGEGDHVEAALPGGIRLMWDTEELIRKIDPEWQPPTGQRIALAFRCEDAADVDATFARVVAAGFRGAKEPWDAFWGQRYAQVFDPDGNKVDLFAPLG